MQLIKIFQKRRNRKKVLINQNLSTKKTSNMKIYKISQTKQTMWICKKSQTKQTTNTFGHNYMHGVTEGQPSDVGSY